jgi:transcriptional regulator with XRE-family HTH domain
MRPSGNPQLIQALAIVMRRRRQELDYTQEDVAGHAQIDRAYITLIESARKQPTLSVLYLLAGALGYSFVEFSDHIDKEYRKILKVSQRRSQ